MSPYEPFKGKSSYVRRPMAGRGISTMHAGSGFIVLDSYGGRINEIAPDATAFVHRDALYSCQFGAYWSGDGQSTALSWISSFYRAMSPYVSQYAYQNYIDPDLASWKDAYYSANYGRLVDVKKRPVEQIVLE